MFTDLSSSKMQDLLVSVSHQFSIGLNLTCFYDTMADGVIVVYFYLI